MGNQYASHRNTELDYRPKDIDAEHFLPAFQALPRASLGSDTRIVHEYSHLYRCEQENTETDVGAAPFGTCQNDDRVIYE